MPVTVLWGLAIRFLNHPSDLFNSISLLVGLEKTVCFSCSANASDALIWSCKETTFVTVVGVATQLSLK